ncbi:MAG TPA: DUF3291 domain-containing protein [Phototrophicaceae bacterium]|nr:DUF3291 domain-containing protein [Phototrophicaceae bacterium]
MDYHLAQFNIARMLDEIDTPLMAEFVANLDRLNGLAEQSSGFVWRLKSDDSDDSTSIRIYDDHYLIVNMSVWETIEALHEFTYYSAHTDIYRRRREWFEKPEVPILVLWWIPAGHTPTAAEGKVKLEYLQQHGVTPEAFTFKQRFTVEEWLAEREKVE